MAYLPVTVLGEPVKSGFHRVPIEPPERGDCATAQGRLAVGGGEDDGETGWIAEGAQRGDGFLQDERIFGRCRQRHDGLDGVKGGPVGQSHQGGDDDKGFMVKAGDEAGDHVVTDSTGKMCSADLHLRSRVGKAGDDGCVCQSALAGECAQCGGSNLGVTIA